MKKLILSFSMVAAVITANAQLTVTDSLSATQVENLLQGIGVSISNLVINCPAYAMGQFSGTSEIPITNGLLLTSGQADVVIGPNNNGAATGSTSMAPGDADLDSLSGSFTYDACVLEFDCIPTGDTLLFNFAFGSEEYLEFVGGFNDVFAIFLSGPGINGRVNAAALPNGTAVSINNVNNNMNSSYYYDNENPMGVYTQYDGFTQNLTAFSVVQPNQTYHFKVAIADNNDAILDSGVFLEAFSFRSTADVSSIAETELMKAIAVFPNPSEGIFNLRDNEGKFNGSKISVFNYLGELVYVTTFSNQTTTLDLFSQANGIYFVKIDSENGSVAKTIIKK